MVEGKYPYMSNVITKDKRPMCTESKVIHQSYIFDFFLEKKSVRVKAKLTFLIFSLLLDFFYLNFFSKWLNKNMYTFFLQKAKCTVKSHLSFLVTCYIDLNFYFFWCFCVNSSCNKCHKYEPQSIQLNETNGFESK